MHYYSRNIPAYALDTAHLTLIEHGAYNRLIDLYYTQEAPIENNLPKLHRLLCARTPDEQQAIQVVLDEFFTLTADGYSHRRCNKELAAYHEKAERNRANGIKGGRPRKVPGDAAPEPTETQSVISGMPEETLTNNRKPLTVKEEETVPISGHDDQPAAESVSVPRFRMDRWLKAQGVAPKDITAWLAVRKVKKAANTEIAAEDLAREAVKAGLSVPDAVHEAATRNWAGFKASWLAEDRRKEERGTAVVVGIDSARQRPVSKQAALEARNNEVANQLIAELTGGRHD